MAKLSGLGRLLNAFKRLLAQIKARFKASVTVGFAQPYAIAVHEMVLWKHKVGQAKYLETASNNLRNEVRNDIKIMVKNGTKLSTALLIAGLKIQKAAEKLVPVDTGALKASGFTAMTNHSEAAAEAAHRRGEIQRNKTLAQRGP